MIWERLDTQFEMMIVVTAVTFRPDSGYNHSWYRTRDGRCCRCAWHTAEGEVETAVAAVVLETAKGDAQNSGYGGCVRHR